MRTALAFALMALSATVAAKEAAPAARIERLDPRLDGILARDARVDVLAEGLGWAEGPLWDARSQSLLFSDVPRNAIYRWRAGAGVETFLERSGYVGTVPFSGREPGSNGLAFDPQGRLVFCRHGERDIARLEADGRIVALADRYRGKRLNSPNDLVYRSDGSLYFTDPPFGLPKFYDDPRKELPYSGVFRLQRGELTLLANDLKGPNGIAFSPDEKYLYVGNWDPAAKTVTRYPVRRTGLLGKAETFIDLTQVIPGEEALDGIKVDTSGNIYLSAPGGLWIFDSTGKHLGTVRAPKPIHNFAWGGADGQTLYLCARSALYRLPLLVAGVRP